MHCCLYMHMPRGWSGPRRRTYVRGTPTWDVRHPEHRHALLLVIDDQTPPDLCLSRAACRWRRAYAWRALKEAALTCGEPRVATSLAAARGGLAARRPPRQTGIDTSATSCSPSTTLPALAWRCPRLRLLPGGGGWGGCAHTRTTRCAPPPPRAAAAARRGACCTPGGGRGASRRGRGPRRGARAGRRRAHPRGRRHGLAWRGAPPWRWGSSTRCMWATERSVRTRPWRQSTCRVHTGRRAGPLARARARARAGTDPHPRHAARACALRARRHPALLTHTPWRWAACNAPRRDATRRAATRRARRHSRAT